MSVASLQVFDPRRTVQLQGFSGRAATTMLHDAIETGFQISGIFQAAEDFANVQLLSSYDYFNHLRVKPLPVTELCGLTLQYDMEVLPVNSAPAGAVSSRARARAWRALRVRWRPERSRCAPPGALSSRPISGGQPG